MKYHALFVIFEKKVAILGNCLLMQIIGGILWVKLFFVFLPILVLRINFTDNFKTLFNSLPASSDYIVVC